MNTTKFRYQPLARDPLSRGQIIICAVASLLSLAILGGGAWMAHARASAPVQAVDPNSFQGGMAKVFSAWKRDVLHSTPTQAAPVAQAATPVQVQQPAQVQPQDTPPSRGLTGRPRPPEAEPIEQSAAVQPTPFPTPYLAPEAMPDPVAARYSEWKTMRDAYAKQQLVRAQNAKTDAERGQIQADVARWRANNPEPPKPKPIPNEGEIPIR